MISAGEISIIGRINKAHGIHGEMSVTFFCDLDPTVLRCIIMDVDGIYVPFFINNVRPKGSGSVLLTVDGISDETEVSDFYGKDIYALKSDLQDCDDTEEDADGWYASDFIGYAISDNHGVDIGTITDVDDSTDNALFLVRSGNGDIRYIPIADEFFIGIDTGEKRITMNLPNGLLDI